MNPRFRTRDRQTHHAAEKHDGVTVHAPHKMLGRPIKTTAPCPFLDVIDVLFVPGYDCHTAIRALVSIIFCTGARFGALANCLDTDVADARSFNESLDKIRLRTPFGKFGILGRDGACNNVVCNLVRGRLECDRIIIDLLGVIYIVAHKKIESRAMS